MENRREILKACGVGLATTPLVTTTGAASEDDEEDCDEGCLEVLGESSSRRIARQMVNDRAYYYIVEKESGRVWYRSYDNDDASIQATELQDLSSDEIEIQYEDIVVRSDPFIDRTGTYLGITQWEAGIAMETGKDVGKYTGAALGGAICACVPWIEAAGNAACSVFGTAVIDAIGYEGDNEFTYGAWDEPSYRVPTVRRGVSAEYTDTTSGMFETYKVPTAQLDEIIPAGWPE